MYIVQEHTPQFKSFLCACWRDAAIEGTAWPGSADGCSFSLENDNDAVDREFWKLNWLNAGSRAMVLVGLLSTWLSCFDQEVLKIQGFSEDVQPQGRVVIEWLSTNLLMSLTSLWPQLAFTVTWKGVKIEKVSFKSSCPIYR